MKTSSVLRTFEQFLDAVEQERVAQAFGASSPTRFAGGLGNMARVAVAGDARLRRRMAAQNATPGFVKEWMCRNDPDISVRASAVTQPDITSETLVWASGDHGHQVRAAVARHPSTPLDVLNRLSGDPAPDVRHAVAKNVFTPEQVLYGLIDDPDVYVREAARRSAGRRAGCPDP